MDHIKVRNPVAVAAMEVSPLAKGLRHMQDQTLGLWWNLKAGGNVALEHVGASLQRRFGVKLHQEYHQFPVRKAIVEHMTAAATTVVGATGD